MTAHSPSPCGVPGHLLVPDECLACAIADLERLICAYAAHVGYHEGVDFLDHGESPALSGADLERVQALARAEAER